ncbi:anti-sigma factor antagonist [Streptomyces ferrugineus]|uniref:Anti-sigma factor antagonist n=1 Tax=Streptomyces ferrugineus TaxID=1413221 RepID=A0A7M2SCJ0_9ACTN|nr:anti-sigma factor antagonist [Streptomyces ferrugineus]QOV34036.1 anti-sigma factor antagonist [Streptomyces ferrugineus]
MTIEWRYTVERDLGVLSVAGYLGPEAVRRFSGAIGWVVARGAGPVIVDLTELRGWSAEGRLAITEAARRLAAAGRGLELAAIPADGSLVPDGDCPEIPVHSDLTAAFSAHARHSSDPEEGQQAWRTDGWPT